MTTPSHETRESALLLIVKRDEPRLLEFITGSFSRYSDVRVIPDRRIGERRRQGERRKNNALRSRDRRQGDRRIGRLAEEHLRTRGWVLIQLASRTVVAGRA